MSSKYVAEVPGMIEMCKGLKYCFLLMHAMHLYQTQITESKSLKITVVGCGCAWGGGGGGGGLGLGFDSSSPFPVVIETYYDYNGKQSNNWNRINNCLPFHRWSQD